MSLPVTVLTGFLGAGKTTFLARLLRQPHGLRVGLIINEIGIAGTETVAASESAYLELTEGCVCCTRNPDLIAALTEYAARGDLDRVIIETTGVADPLALTFVLERPDLEPIARLDAVVTVVDALNWERTRGQPEWRAQVGAADLLVIAKTDVAPDLAALSAVLTELNPAARQLGRDVPLSVLLDVEPAPRAGSPANHSGFTALSLAGPHVYRLEPLEDLLETLPQAIYRAKGVVRVENGRWASFHVVAGRLQLESNSQPPPHGESRIVLIGKGIDREEVTAALAACT